MRKTGLTSKLLATGSCLDPLDQTYHSKPTALINITHGRLCDLYHTHAPAHIMLTVSDSKVALGSAYSLIEHLESFDIVIETLHGIEDAELWLRHLARLRARSIRGENHVILVIERENDVHLNHKDWLAYNDPLWV